jgi:hypothetical protein
MRSSAESRNEEDDDDDTCIIMLDADDLDENSAHRSINLNLRWTRTINTSITTEVEFDF